MTPERFREIDRLLAIALERGEGEREAFVAEACRGDDELRREVESLLHAGQSAEDFMDRPPTAVASEALDGVPLGICNEATTSCGAALCAGDTVGRFVVLFELGSGGMGTVYAARDPELDRKVALKVLRSDGATAGESRGRLVREAKALARLSHPNVVPVFEASANTEQVFLAMEYVEGCTLADWLARERRPWREILGAFVQAGRGLAAAHDAGILHRDFKPRNVLVGNDGRVRVVDFGLAKSAGRQPNASSQGAPLNDRFPAQFPPGSITRRGQTMGTPAYMSPEQLKGGPIDARSDQFSFCMALHEALYSELPFDVEGASALIPSTGTGPHVGSSQGTGGDGRSKSIAQAAAKDAPRWKRVPSSIRRILSRGLQVDAAERYPAMEVLIHELERAAARRRRREVIGGIGIALLALLAVTSIVLLRREPAARGVQSVAVLPIEGATGGGTDDFLLDGIAEGVRNSLAQLGSLRVISRGSAMKYKHQTGSLARIGRELGADAVVRGTLALSGDRLELSVELVQTASDQHLWGHRYSRDRHDLAALPADLARDVVAQLKARITPEEQERLMKSQAVEPEVYEAYVEGRYFLAKSTGASVSKSMDCFERALLKNPNFAPAYAGIADAYLTLGSPLTVLSLSDSTRKAREAVMKALALDDTLADAHFTLAMIRYRYDWDWDGAEKEFLRAIRLSPGRAYMGYGNFLLQMGRIKEGCAELERARKLDPVSPIAQAGMAACFRRKKQFQGVIDSYLKALEIDPNYPRAHAHLSGVYARLGRYSEALAENEKANQLFGPKPSAWTQAVYALYYALQGRRAQAEEILKQLEASPLTQQTNAATTMAKAYAALSRPNEAFTWLTKAYEARSDSLLELNQDPFLEPLRADPRFQELVRKMGLPP